MNPIEKIIEKIEKEHGENGGYAVLRECYKHRNTENFYETIGFLWGLYTAEIISEDERSEAMKFLINIDRQKGESL